MPGPLPPPCGKLAKQVVADIVDAGADRALGLSVCIIEAAFAQYSLDELASKIFGQVLLSSQRRSR